MVRIDMSEYMEKHAVARLIGAPPGYVGYEEGGQLTEAVRRRPHAVVLFDEIEKAHPDVFHVLLQILDDGRLTDSQGRTVDFRNVVVLMTSNIGSQHILEATQAGAWADVEKVVRGQLHKHFRPEFLNRVDDVVVFRPLGEAELRKIVELQLHRVEKLVADLGLVLEVSEAAKAFLAKDGFDPVYGARPLKRAIQRQIQDPLALHLLDEEVAEGTVIRVDVAKEGARLEFESLAGPALAPAPVGANA
jgi:ATP-dependent Clp protease ATP-binding subunit ClpB